MRSTWASQERLTAILEATSDLVSTALPNGQLSYLNRSGRRMLGYDDHESIDGVNISDIHPKWAMEIIEKQGISTAVRDGVWIGETAVLTRDGKEIPVSQVIMSHRAPDDELEYLSTIVRDISQLKKAEKALLRITKALESTSDSIGMSDPEGHHFYQNKAFTDLFEYSAEELEAAGGGPTVYVNPKVGEEVFSTIMSGRSWSGEIEMISKSGRKFPVSLRADAIKDDCGNIVGLIGVHTDITEQKRKEEALRENEEKYRGIFDESVAAIYVFDHKKQFVDSNQAGLDLLGYSRDELLNMNISDIAVADPTGVLMPNEHLFSGTRILNNEHKLKRVDGKIITVLDNSKPLTDVNGEIIGIQSTLIDITERKEARIELRHLRNLLSNIVNSMPSILIAVDHKEKVNQWNREAERVTGIRAEEAQGRLLTEVFPQLEGEMEKVRQAINDYKPLKQEKMTREREGIVRNLEVTIYPLIADGGDGAVIRIDDVTERVRIEEMMIQSEKMLSVGGLAAGTAHEINNPLAGIIQNVQVMEQRLTKNLPGNISAAKKAGINLSSIKKYMEIRGIFSTLEDIKNSGNRAGKIVENMLSFSRKSDARFTLNSIKELLDKTIDLASNDYDLKKNYDFRKIDIVRDYDNTVPNILCDGSKIQQVFLNILKNGAQAMTDLKERREQSRFIVRVLPDGDMIRVEIEDNGPGIDKTTCKRVFEPFFTTKSAGVGTGLGLYVSYFIITENHRGTMVVESSYGEGAKFIVRLPIGD
ncbi:MAG: PAS domain S-box protein [Proteobacteria bacterium]|nr:PAS domain S-box protein [Pseudomonadota bacterium]